MYFLFVIAMLSCVAFAADVSFEGTLEADYANHLEKNFTVNNAANQDLRLKMNVDLDESVRAVVGVASVSTYTSPDGSMQYSRIRHREQATPISSNEHWSPFLFDGISLEWTIKRDLTFIFGDMFYSFGSFNYYYWRNDNYYAGILKTQGLRGVGVRLGSNGYVYAGASDSNDKSGRIAASYAIDVPGLDKVDHKFSFAPMLDLIKGGGRAHSLTFGVDANYSRSYTEFNYALRGIWGIHPNKDSYVNTFTLEPSFNYKSFSLASTCYFALLSNDDSEGSATISIDETYAPDERLIYIEPSFSINKSFSVGLGGEYHKADKASGGNWFLIAPTTYLYPTAGMDLSFWYGYAIKDGPDHHGFGISSSVKF
ncbi:MAG: hypothetical protein LBH25_08710 [Fibromonadaceae bacterium]|jgi:hypothetical protein|nr:hypothetical protein [Fibromonadaceae bacterium]